jgi:PhnB protein
MQAVLCNAKRNSGGERVRPPDKGSKCKLSWFDNVEWRQHPWQGLTWLTSAIVCDDVRAAVHFYSQGLGFVPIFELPNDDGRLLFARMRYRGANFTVNARDFEPGLAPPQGGETPTFLFYLYVDNVAEAVAKVTALGAEVTREPKEEFWGDIRARFTDPFGYVWDIAQPIQKP